MSIIIKYYFLSAIKLEQTVFAIVEVLISIITTIACCKSNPFMKLMIIVPCTNNVYECEIKLSQNINMATVRLNCIRDNLLPKAFIVVPNGELDFYTQYG